MTCQTKSLRVRCMMCDVIMIYRYFKGATTTCKDAIIHDHVICFQVVCSIFSTNYYKSCMSQGLLHYYVINIIVNFKSDVYDLARIDVSSHVKSLWSKVVLLLIYVHGIIVERS
jgi:hypothetical protein